MATDAQIAPRKRIAIGAMMRNAEGYIPRYIDQYSQLLGWLAPHYDINWILAIGASTDRTEEILRERAGFLANWARRATSVDTNFFTVDGGKVYGSVDDADRWRNISRVCDGVLERVGPQDEALIYVESDLVWTVETILALYSHLGNESAQIDAIAPMCFHQKTGHFYDIWGHRKNGQRFRPTPPYHPEVSYRLTEIDSAGSCIVMKGEVARNCRFNPPELGIVGFAHDLRSKGYKLWLDPTLFVEHP